MGEQLFKNLSGAMEYKKKLADLVTYRIGGEARYFYTPKSATDILELLAICQKNSMPLFVLGSGSNLLVSDMGFDGVVLSMGPTSKDVEAAVEIVSQNDTEVVLKVPASFGKARLLDITLKNSWSGLEFSAGIPGSMGGAVYMNAGTKWGSYGEIIEQVEFVSLNKGIFSLRNKEIGFKYRGHGEGLLDGGTLVTSLTLKLRKDIPLSSIFNKVDEILSYRGLRQPLELPNCGSVFKNPANSEKGAGRLIEACNLKGSCIGNAEISLKHANFILNKGSARSSDVADLITKIKETVYSKFNILLEPEVIFVGTV